MAKDYYMVCDNEFPAVQLADHMTKQNLNPSLVQTRVQMVDSAL